MLVFSLKIGERIGIGDDVVVTVREIHAAGVRLSLEAPFDVPREERIGERPPGEKWDAPAEPACDEAV